MRNGSFFSVKDFIVIEKKISDGRKGRQVGGSERKKGKKEKKEKKEGREGRNEGKKEGTKKEREREKEGKKGEINRKVLNFRPLKGE